MSGQYISWEDATAMFKALSLGPSPAADQKLCTHNKDAKELAAARSQAPAAAAAAAAVAAPAAAAATRPRTAADAAFDWSDLIRALPRFEHAQLTAPLVLQPAVAAAAPLAVAPPVAAPGADDKRAELSRERVERFFRNNQPATTKATYNTYQKRYLSFMHRKRYPLHGPNTNTYAAEFIAECSVGGHGNKPLAVTTILGPVAAAIANYYRFEPEWPTVSKIFKQTKTVVRKVAPKPRAAKAPLPLEWLRAAVEAALRDTDRVTGLRDALILLIMYGAFLREAEVVALKPINVKVASVTVNGTQRDAVTIRVEHAKNDQEGHGSDRTVPALPGSPMCMYSALLDYNSRRLYSCGLMFYNTQNGKRGQRLSTKTPTYILRHRLTEAKMPASELAKYASNSLRKGGVTRAITEGNSRELVKQHGAWRSDAGVNAYISADKSALAELVISIFKDKNADADGDSDGDHDDDIK
jgi:hypothetical protein